LCYLGINWSIIFIVTIKQVNNLEKIKNKEISPLYLFIGEEEFFKEKARNILKDRILTSEGKTFNYDVLNSVEVKEEDIFKLATSMPMMSDRRLIIVKNFEKLKETKLLERYIENPSQNSVVIFDSDENKLKSDFYFKLKEKSFYAEFKPLYDKLKLWLKVYINERGKKILDKNAEFMYECIGGNTHLLVNEIEKMLLYMGDKEEITRDVIYRVTGIPKDFNIFELRNAIGAKDLNKSIHIVNKMIERGENEAGIIIMITEYFIQLGKIKYFEKKITDKMEKQGINNKNEIKKEILKKCKAETGIHSFIIEKYYIPNIKNYSWTKIKMNFKFLTETDMKMKTGFKDTKTLFTLLVKNLIKSEKFETL